MRLSSERSSDAARWTIRQQEDKFATCRGWIAAAKRVEASIDNAWKCNSSKLLRRYSRYRRSVSPDDRLDKRFRLPQIIRYSFALPQPRWSSFFSSPPPRVCCYGRAHFFPSYA